MNARENRARVVVAGGGVAALEFVLGLEELLPGVADVELVSPDDAFTYRPLAVAETFGAGTPYRVELTRIAARLGARRRRGRVVEVDTNLRVARTDTSDELPYDVLVIACGARAAEGVPGALTFCGERDEAAFRALLDELATGTASSLAFVVPPYATWPLPLYELALMSAAELAHRGVEGHRLLLVTPEMRPLAEFGAAASDAVAELLDTAGIDVHCGRAAVDARAGELRLAAGDPLRADRVVALPWLQGPAIAGLPRDADGFVPTDAHGLVESLDNVWAAGDVTTFPLKHGGLAVLQADAVAEAVAARLGAAINPAPFRPVLRGMLLTGATPRFLAADLDPGAESSAVAVQPLWWPPTKIAGGWLARFLHAEGLPVPPPPGGPGTLPVELQLSGR